MGTPLHGLKFNCPQKNFSQNQNTTNDLDDRAQKPSAFSQAGVHFMSRDKDKL